MTDAKKRGRGRVRKLTKDVEETILRHLKAGGYLSHAAEAAGINARTLAYWLEWGQERKKPYAEFAEKVMKLRGEHALRLQSILTRAAMGHIEGDWKSALAILERGWPKVWGQAAMQAAAVTVRTGPGAANSGDSDEAATTVSFYLPSNGRRPDEGDEGGGA